jgi:hypothetical protein
MNNGFHFSQWNDPAWRAKQPAQAKSDVAELPEAEVSAVPQCSHCGSTTLRPAGWFTSKRWEEKHEDVQCRDCKKYSRLPVGVVLPKKPARVIEPESVVLANDPRPCCPRCNESSVHRRDKLPSGKRRYFCTNCQIRFIATDCAEYIDHRKVQHWHEIEPREEAAFLFRYAKRNGGDFASMRATIDVAEKEKKDLDYLVSEGALLQSEVSAALWYRMQVIEVFDALVRKERLARGRVTEFLETAGLSATGNTRRVVEACDEAMRQFDVLVDVELQVLAESCEKKVR